MRVLLKAAFNRITGYGNDAVDIARWLDMAGVDVRVFPASFMTPVPEDFAMLLTKPLPKDEYDVTIQFLPPYEIAIREKASPRRRNNGLPLGMARLHVGWSMWEKDRLTRKDMRGHSVGAAPWRLLDKMYVTWPGCVAAFQNYDPKVKYAVLPCGIDPAGFAVKRREVTGPTKFCMIGELHQRKDPFVAIEAFRELKQEHADFDAELHLKTTRPGLHPGLSQIIDGLYVHTSIWPYDELIKWMHGMHCYVGPSRGEGNLKPPMEFMATGGTAIVTNWSGPTNWLHEDVTYPLDYVLRPLDPTDPDSPMEARASKEHLKELMWHVHTHRLEASEKGWKAADWIRQVAGWDGIIAKLVRDLERELLARP